MGKISKEDEILIKNLRIEKRMSNIFSTSFGINFAKLTRVWLALISLTAKINSLLFLSHPVGQPTRPTQPFILQSSKPYQMRAASFGWCHLVNAYGVKSGWPCGWQVITV